MNHSLDAKTSSDASAAMKSGILTFIVFTAAIVSAGTLPQLSQETRAVSELSDVVTGLTGTWFNELGSQMNLTASSDGFLSGNYSSAVGTAIDFYTLTGRFDTQPPSGRGVSLAWTVTYLNNRLNAHSTAGWSGQFFPGSNPQILTQWLLTTSSTLANVWSSVNIGHDAFTQVKPAVQHSVCVPTSARACEMTQVVLGPL